MNHNNKISEYVERVERCVPAIIRNMHISIPKEVMGLKLTISQVLTLVNLGYNKTCKMSVLAEGVNLNLSAMTGIIDALIQEGLVERERSKEDRRVVLVYLTQKGRRIANKLRYYRKKEIRSIIEYLKEDEREDIIRGFEKVVEAFSIKSKEKKS